MPCLLPGLYLADSFRVANQRLATSGTSAILPIEWNARIAKNELSQDPPTGFGANVVRQNDYAILGRLHANPGAGSLAVVTTLIEAMALRAVETRQLPNQRTNACTDPCSANPAEVEIDGQSRYALAALLSRRGRLHSGRRRAPERPRIAADRRKGCALREAFS